VICLSTAVFCSAVPPLRDLLPERYSYINMARIPAIKPMKASILADQGSEVAASECSIADVTDANTDPILLAILPPVVVVMVALFVIVELITVTPVLPLVAVPLATPVSPAAISSNCQLNHLIRFSFEQRITYHYCGKSWTRNCPRRITITVVHTNLSREAAKIAIVSTLIRCVPESPCCICTVGCLLKSFLT